MRSYWIDLHEIVLGEIVIILLSINTSKVWQCEDGYLLFLGWTESVIEIEGPLVNSQFYAPTAGKEDEKLTSGSFKCTCTLFDGLPCSTHYSTAELLEMRMHHLSMTREELDIIVLAKLSTAIHVDQTTTASKQKPNQRKKIRSQYRHEGHNIKRLTTLLKHLPLLLALSSVLLLSLTSYMLMTPSSSYLLFLTISRLL